MLNYLWRWDLWLVVPERLSEAWGSFRRKGSPWHFKHENTEAWRPIFWRPPWGIKKPVGRSNKLQQNKLKRYENRSEFHSVRVKSQSTSPFLSSLWRSCGRWEHQNGRRFCQNDILKHWWRGRPRSTSYEHQRSSVRSSLTILWQITKRVWLYTTNTLTSDVHSSLMPWSPVWLPDTREGQRKSFEDYLQSSTTWQTESYS